MTRCLYCTHVYDGRGISRHEARCASRSREVDQSFVIAAAMRLAYPDTIESGAGPNRRES